MWCDCDELVSVQYEWVCVRVMSAHTHMRTASAGVGVCCLSRGWWSEAGP